MARNNAGNWPTEILAGASRVIRALLPLAPVATLLALLALAGLLRFPNT
jgi:hypothetical protein